MHEVAGCQPKPKAEADKPLLRPWSFWISQKPDLIIVLLYIERILSFSLRHEMFSQFVPTLPFPQVLAVFHLSHNQQTAPLPPSSTFLCLLVLVFNYFFDVLLGQRSKPGSLVFASSLTASNTKRADLTWLPLEIIHRGHTWHDYPWPWVSLTWFLYNLQLQSQSKWLGHFGVSLSPQCWCTRFGDRTAINNFERDEVSTRREKTAFG